MPIWHMDDFELKAVEKKTGKLSAHAPSLPLGRTEQFLITGDNSRLLTCPEMTPEESV